MKDINYKILINELNSFIERTTLSCRILKSQQENLQRKIPFKRYYLKS